MKTLKSQFARTFEEEIMSICRFYELDSQKTLETIIPLSSYFEDYWEMVFSVNGFEIITAGTGTVFSEKIRNMAGRTGLSVKTQLFYDACHIAFPSAIAGIKLCFSKKEKALPTLYLRTKIDMTKALDFLKDHLGLSESQRLKSVLKDNNILYGLGFSEKNKVLYFKTYTIGDIKTESGEITKGFVSYRLNEEKLLKEHKTYLPDVILSAFRPENPELKNLVDFMTNSLQYTHAGHIGVLYENDLLVSHKIYIERIGGIPTDFSAQ